MTIEYISLHDLERQLSRLNPQLVTRNPSKIKKAMAFAIASLDNDPRCANDRAFLTLE